jgi:hypothetical protein
MATKSRQSAELGIGRLALIVGSGIGVIVIGTWLALGASTKRVETFGLADLVNVGPDEGDGLSTPLQEARRSFNERYKVTPEARNPEIAGTKLMLRAISELNARERDIKVRDAVRHLRDHPEVTSQVYALVDQYLASNPQLAENGHAVKTAVAEQLKTKPSRRLDFLDH